MQIFLTLYSKRFQDKFLILSNMLRNHIYILRTENLLREYYLALE